MATFGNNLIGRLGTRSVDVQPQNQLREGSIALAKNMTDFSSQLVIPASQICDIFGLTVSIGAKFDNGSKSGALTKKCLFLRTSLEIIEDAWLVGKDQRIYRPDYSRGLGLLLEHGPIEPRREMRHHLPGAWTKQPITEFTDNEKFPF